MDTQTITQDAVAVVPGGPDLSRLAELAATAGDFTDGRQLLDALSHALDEIPDLDVIESPDYRRVARRIAELLYAPDQYPHVASRNRNPHHILP